MFQVKNLILMKGLPPAIFSCSRAVYSVLSWSVVGSAFSSSLEEGGDALEAADEVDVEGSGSEGPREND